MIKKHHEGYISWEEFEAVQKQITNNANMKGAMVRGSVKKGQALLGGLIRCGRCGRKMLVHYSKGKTIRYQCKGALQNHGAPKCIGFGGLRIDESLSEILIEVVSPLGVEAALKASQTLEQNQDDLRKHHTLALQQARYEAERIERQFEAVEPENRLVALELEKRWEQALIKVTQCEQQLAAVPTDLYKFTEKDKASLLDLGTHLRQLWYSNDTSFEFKKHVARTLIEEIIADIEDDKVKLVIHWHGGVHTELESTKNKLGHHRYVTDNKVTTLIEKLARYMPDNDIASLLNRLGKKTGRGHAWNESYVRSFRNTHEIAVFKNDEHHQRGELTIAEASKQLEMPTHAIIRLIKRNILPAKQICKGALWIIEEETVNTFIEQHGKGAKTKTLVLENPNQLSLDVTC